MPATSQGLRAQPTFTIEQIELIRRLRNSGLSKEQVIQAFEAFERVDTELGNLYTVPISLSQHKSFTAAGPQVRSVQSGHLQQVPNSQPYSYSQPPASFTINGHSHSTDPPTTSQSQTSELPAGHVNRRFQGIRRPREVKVEGEETSGSEESAHPSVQEDQTKSVPAAGNDNMKKEVDDFLKKGTEQMHAEIREYLFSHPAIMHNDIALAAGVGVTCVSKFLIGNFTSLQPQVLRQLCQWFLTVRFQPPSQLQRQPPQQQQQQCNTQTSKLLQDVLQERLMGNSSSPMDTGQDIKPFDALMGTPGFGEQEGLAVNFTPRRERFTFRKKHLEVLETYFKTNQYPTYEERIDIAQRCNDIMEVTSGRGLGDKERMTPQNVAYWFSNRRKDIKRMAREGGIEMSEVVLPSKVRQSPPLTYIDNDAAGVNSAAWVIETSGPNYSPVDMPSVGPVAFPTMMHRAFNEPNTNADTASASSDSQSEQLVIKVEPSETEPPPGGTAANGPPGSAVDRIAAEISSHLMSMSEGPAASVDIASSQQPREETQSASSQQQHEEAAEEPESH